MSLTETKADLLKDLMIAPDTEFNSLETMVKGETKFLRDLRANFKNAIASGHLGRKDALLIALSVAVNERNPDLIDSFTLLSTEAGANDAEIAEVFACASMLATNNVLYKFKHFIHPVNEKYKNMPAGIKMNVMMSPVLGKEMYELISLVISALNGCESCVNSHEEALRKLGTEEPRIFDAVRLGSIVRGLSIALT